MANGWVGSCSRSGYGSGCAVRRYRFENPTFSKKTWNGTGTAIEDLDRRNTLYGCSEIVALPNILLKMLEPLKQTNEVALTVNDEDKIVTATSFHHSDAVGGGSDGSGGSENMALAALAAGVMKTETSIVCDGIFCCLFDV